MCADTGGLCSPVSFSAGCFEPGFQQVVVMRVALIGVSHWHWQLYVKNLLEVPDVSIVGVSDGDAATAAQVADRVGCRGWTDYREMCLAARPDMIFALGYHTEMAELAHFLLDQRIPFTMEKPCGASSAEVEDVARHAAEAGSFASVCFSLRASPLLPLIAEVAPGERVHNLSFKFVGGLLSRYPAMNSEWVVQRSRSRGGALLNLGVHGLDLICTLLPQAPAVVGATMSNSLGHYDVEDQAMVLLRAGDSLAMVETAYAYPAGRSTFDLHYSIRTDKHYFVVENDRNIEYADESGVWTRLDAPTSNGTCYQPFVRETLRRVERNEPPLANMTDMVKVMHLVEAAYAMAPLGEA